MLPKAHRVRLSLAVLAAMLLSPTLGLAAPVDLNTWTAESYAAVAGFGAGVWNVSQSGDTVTQTVNGQPTLFYSDFNALGTDVRGGARVGVGDNDYFGFAIGFRPGDTTNSAADYLLVDWKQGTQPFDFGPPSNTPGSTAFDGLAVSRVTGIPTADEFWGHTDFAQDAGGGLTELARGNTLGSTGWADNTDYVFQFVFQTTGLKVFVDGVLQLDVAGNFSNGRMAFYNFSQANVTYSAFTRDPAPPVPGPAPLPGPATGLLLAAGLLALVARSRS